MNNKKKANIIFLFWIILLFYVQSCSKEETKDIPVISLEKIASFEANFLKCKVIIGKIDSFCIDKENNIYIADSGLNQIHKFGPDGNYITSYGREGQGPGEFMGNARFAPLRISYGNDHKFYIYDLGNNRLSIFSNDFGFIKAYTMPVTTRILDTPVVNSRGDIYLVGRIGNKLIHKFNNNLELIASFLDSKDHFQFPFHKPATISPFVGEFDLRKAITKNDFLIAISNYSLTAFCFNEKGDLIKKFRINNELFIKDFSERMSLLKRDEKKRQGIFLPFYLFIDSSECICLAYFNSKLDNYEIYVYSQDGKFKKVLRFPEKITIPIQGDFLGNIYALDRKGNEESIIKYKPKSLKEGK